MYQFISVSSPSHPHTSALKPLATFPDAFPDAFDPKLRGAANKFVNNVYVNVFLI